MALIDWNAESVANATTTGAQGAPSVVTLSNGNYVVVWQDGSTQVPQVRFRIFDAAGLPVTGEVIVDSGDPSALRDPSIAVLSDGGFAITVERESGELDDVFTAFYNASGGSQGGAFIAMDATGEPNPTLIGGQGSPVNVYLVNGGANGNVLFDPLYGGTTLPVDSNTQLNERHPTGVRLFDGRAAVVWFDLAANTLAFRFLTSSGGYASPQFNLNPGMATPLSAPIAAAPNTLGGFTLAYTALFGGESKVSLAIVDGSGNIQGSPFGVSPELGNQVTPRIVLLQDGGFAVVWTDENAANTALDSTIECRLFEANGTPRTAQFTLSAPSDASLADIAALQDGRLVVVWTQTVNGSSEVVQQIVDPRDGVVNGNGTLYGNNATNDTITGNGGVDTLHGLNGNDRLAAGGGGDFLFGGDGDDVLIGGAGPDSLFGGNGSDTASYEDSLAGVGVALGGVAPGFDESQNDALTGIENLLGSAFADALGGDGGTNTLDGAGGDDTLTGGAGADRLIGGEGRDTASYATANAGVVATLGIGIASGFSHATGDVLVSIENLEGSVFADHLIGNGDDNTLTGGDGDDLLNGGAGADRLVGGGGIDTASYEDSAAGVQARLSAEILSEGGDLFDGVENLRGSAFADGLGGNAGANTLEGRGGDDTLEGKGGADHLAGGEGADTVSYDESAAVQVALDGFLAPGGGEAAGDSFASIENLRGSAFADLLRGEGGSNALEGGDGDDRLEGMAGADLLDGGTGIDTASYAAGTAVQVALDGTLAKTGDAQGDQFLSIENLLGSGGGDRLRGNAGANALSGGLGHDSLEGQGGADSLAGGGGDDRLRGGLGADTLTGNAGIDTFIYRSLDESLVDARDTVTDFRRGTDRLDVAGIDANAALAGNQAFVLDAGGTFAAGEVRQVAVTGGYRVNFNVDADTDIELSVLILGGTAPLSAGDLVL